MVLVMVGVDKNDSVIKNVDDYFFEIFFLLLFVIDLKGKCIGVVCYW